MRSSISWSILEKTGANDRGCLKSDKTTPHFTFKRLNGVLGKVDPSFKKEGKVLIFSTIVSPPLQRRSTLTVRSGGGGALLRQPPTISDY